MLRAVLLRRCNISHAGRLVTGIARRPVARYQAPRLKMMTGTVFTMMRKSSAAERRPMYSMSNANFPLTSSIDESYRWVTCAQPVIPGKTCWRA